MLLCVPDAEIAAAAALVRPGTAGRPLLAARRPRRRSPPHEAFSLHPLMTVTAARGARSPAPAPRSPARTPARARALAARPRAARSACAPVEIADADRAAYHAAASMASNFLVTLEARGRAARRHRRRRPRRARPARARDASRTGPRSAPERALTGPIARGDEETVARQRAAIAERTPELLALFDALADADPRAAPPAERGAGMRTSAPSPSCATRSPSRAAPGARSGSCRRWARFHDGPPLADAPRAASDCDVVVVSLFVNPTQFNEASDLDAYPRDEARDAALAAAAGVDVCSRPPPTRSTPTGSPRRWPSAALTETLEGDAPRPRRTSTASRRSWPSC